MFGERRERENRRHNNDMQMKAEERERERGQTKGGRQVSLSPLSYLLLWQLTKSIYFAYLRTLTCTRHVYHDMQTWMGKVHAQRFSNIVAHGAIKRTFFSLSPSPRSKEGRGSRRKIPLLLSKFSGSESEDERGRK